MKFTLVAVASVEDALADLWLQATDPKEVAIAADWIDRELRNDPLSKVTPVDNLYFLRRDPVVVLCEISVEDRIVRIVEIHRTYDI